ncbi:Ig-like domain-containing protein [Fuerstiella marisgermanici]|uniref:SbsA Ig-like domain-containing protein n=1 Tax=Fuerstiella marisgermanici TaxID=1891926 RepID=A0A1P8WND4_9PLAN|nr:Ig-like domain-containing protein [Fuerstiella marisgermanici]APZ95569.1 hypothetical protein Fuma_05228 [Fuerstiella marisgermanici]
MTTSLEFALINASAICLVPVTGSVRTGMVPQRARLAHRCWAAVILSLTVATFASPSSAATAPKVVSTFPPDAAEDVSTETVLKVQFDQPMRAGSISLEWEGHARESGFRLRGPVTYDESRHEFSLPVCLRPDATHTVSVNPGERHRNFQSAAGVTADVFKWTFETQKAPKASNGAQVVNISPKPDSEVALMTLLRIKFDRPMASEWYGFSAGQDPFGGKCQIAGEVTYDAATHEFVIPVSFPPNWNGTLNLTGFRSADGQPATAKEVPYRTLRTLVSAETEARLAAAERSEELIAVIGKIRDSHSKIRSVKLTATSTMEYSAEVWSYRLTRRTSVFAKQGDKYFGDVSQIMNLRAFQVGSDGKQCWHRHNDKLTVAASDDVLRQNVSIAEGFGQLTEMQPVEVIRKYRLEYAGQTTFNERPCYVLRGWASLESWWSRTKMVGSFNEWLVDKGTGLVVLTRHGRMSGTQFLYESINEDLPPTLFAVPQGAGLVHSPVEPLGEGYDVRFLNVIDGTNGRMSVRWGKHGKAGRSSSGLN